jgi:hypothetical protein
MKNSERTTTLVTVIFFGFLSLVNPSAMAVSPSISPTLGLSVSVLPEADGKVAPIQAGLVNSLALTIKPGTSSVRKVRIQSAAPNVEIVSTSIGHAYLLNGVLTLDESKESPIAPWIEVDKPTVTLAAKKTVDVSLVIAVPEKEPIGIRQAYLLVKATLPKTTATQSDDKQGAARYAIPIYIGVGTTTQIVTSFAVGIITLVTTDEGMAFSIPLVNTGMTPVLPIGYLLLNSVLGKLVFAAQIPFGNGVIQPGGTKTIFVLVPLEVPDAIWNVHAEAHDGSLIATSDSIVTLKRNGLMGTGQIAIYRLALGVVSLILFIFVLLFIRRGRKETDGAKALEL